MDKNTIMGAFSGLALADLKEIQEALRLEVKSRTEEAKIAEKAAKQAAKQAGSALKDNVVLGAMVSFTYKGGVKTGRVDKVTDKTFHVNAEEFDLDYKAGGQLYRYIKFENLVSVEATEDTTEEDMAEAV